MNQKFYPFFQNILFALIVLFGYEISAQNVSNEVSADDYYKKADSLLYYRDFKESIKYFEKALSLYKDTESWVQLASCHNKLSENYRRNVTLDKALYHAERALKICERKLEVHNVEKANALDNLGVYHRVKGATYEIVKDYHEKALKIRSKILKADHVDFAISHYNLGNAKELNGLYDEAMDHFNASLEIRKKHSEEEDVEIANIYESIGQLLYDKGLYDESLRYFEKVYAVASKTYRDDNFYFVRVFNKLGIIYQYRNEYNKSLEYYKKALHISILNLGKNHPDQARLHYNISLIYDEHKQKQKALYHTDKTIEIGIKAFGENYRDLFYPYMFKGHLVRGEKGILYTKKALSICINSIGENHIRTSEVYDTLAKLYEEMGEFDLALDYFNRSLNINLNIFGKKNTNVVNSYNLIARLFLNNNLYDKALIYAEEAIKANQLLIKNNVLINEEFDGCLSYTRLLTSLERKALALKMIYLKEKDIKNLENSIITYEKAIRLIEVIRKTQYNMDDKVAFSRDVKKIFYGGIETQLLYQNGNNNQESIEKIFNYSERSKASILKGLLNEANAKGYSDLPKEVLVFELNLRKAMADATSKLSRQKKEKDGPGTDISEVENDILDISRQQDSLKNVLEKQYPKYYQLKYDNEIISIKEIQSNLNENTTFLEYFVEKNVLYAFVITKNTAVAEELSITDLDKKIEGFRKSILLKNISEYKKLGLQLYNELVDPIKDNFRGEHLLIVPDESLWHLNFDLILTTEVEKDAMHDLPYLLYEYAISYANSANVLFRSNNRMAQKNQLRKECLAFSFSNEDLITQGDVMELEKFRNSKEDLPGTRYEIKAIADIVKGNYFFGSEAVEANFKKNANEYSILHLALHGEVDNENPENSRIYFTKVKDSIEDNLLYSHELYALDISADLTVLTACNTGVGKIAKGEGILSLGTAFQYAGTKSLLLTSWEVPDKTTPAIMRGFYQNLDKGMDKASALQQAKIQYIKTADVFTNHPLYWGGFYVLGDNSPLEIDTPAASNWMIYLIIGLCGVGMLLFFRKKLVS